MMRFLSGENMMQAAVMRCVYLCVAGCSLGRRGPELTGKELQKSRTTWIVYIFLPVLLQNKRRRSLGKACLWNLGIESWRAEP